MPSPMHLPGLRAFWAHVEAQVLWWSGGVVEEVGVQKQLQVAAEEVVEC